METPERKRCSKKAAEIWKFAGPYLISFMQVIGGGPRRRDESGVSEKDSGRTRGDE